VAQAKREVRRLEQPARARHVRQRRLEAPRRQQREAVGVQRRQPRRVEVRSFEARSSRTFSANTYEVFARLFRTNLIAPALSPYVFLGRPRVIALR
jgi:hypothetical protein